MADRQPLKATFYAFRNRGESGVLTRTTLAFAVLALALGVVFFALFWNAIQPLFAWYAQVIQASINNDAAAIQAAGFPMEFFSVFFGILLWTFPFYILCAAYEAGCLRWMIHGEKAGFFGLSLGAPTWRVWSVYWMWLLLNLAFSLVMSILMGVFFGALVLSTGGDATATLAATPILSIVQYGLMIYFAVRLAPAAAVTVARRKFAFFDAWVVTKHRFLPLLGSFVVLCILYGVVSIALGVAAFGYVLGPAAISNVAAAAGDAPRLTEAMMQALQTYIAALSEPRTWLVLGAIQLVSSVIAVLFYLACYGVNARAAQAAIEEGKVKAAA